MSSQDIDNPCDLPLDLFLKLLLDYNDVKKALELINICGRREELNKNLGYLNQFCDYYLIPRPIDPLAQIEDNLMLSTEEILKKAIRMGNIDIIKDKIKDTTKEEDILIYALENKYPDIAQIIIETISKKTFLKLTKYNPAAFRNSIIRNDYIGVLIAFYDKIGNHIFKRGIDEIIRIVIKSCSIRILYHILYVEKVEINLYDDLFIWDPKNCKSSRGMIKLLSDYIEEYYDGGLLQYLKDKARNSVSISMLLEEENLDEDIIFELLLSRVLYDIEYEKENKKEELRDIVYQLLGRNLPYLSYNMSARLFKAFSDDIEIIKLALPFAVEEDVYNWLTERSSEWEMVINMIGSENAKNILF